MINNMLFVNGLSDIYGKATVVFRSNYEGTAYYFNDKGELVNSIIPKTNLIVDVPIPSYCFYEYPWANIDSVTTPDNVVSCYIQNSAALQREIRGGYLIIPNYK